MLVVLDTNVLISALLFPGGAPYAVYELAKRGRIQLCLSEFILLELERVLLEKFQVEPALAALYLDRLYSISAVVRPRKRLGLATKSDDNRILECALASRADFLVTGDKKHILPIARVGNTRIVSPAEFLEIFLGKSV